MRISIKYNILKLILLVFFIIISAGCASEEGEAPEAGEAPEVGTPAEEVEDVTPAEEGTPAQVVTEVEAVTVVEAVTPVEEVVAVTPVVEVTPAEEYLEYGVPDEDYLKIYLGEKEKAGIIVSVIPEKMKVGETETIIANITRNISQSNIGPVEEDQTYVSTNITVTPEMKVTLRGKQREAFIIEPLTEEVQPIVGQRNTTWKWNVTPQKSGTQTLTLNVYLVIPSNSDEPSVTRYIGELKKEINVEVSSDYVIETYLPRVEGILKVVAGILGSILAIWKIIIPLVNNIRNRSKK